MSSCSRASREQSCTGAAGACVQRPPSGVRERAPQGPGPLRLCSVLFRVAAGPKEGEPLWAKKGTIGGRACCRVRY